MPKDKAGKAFEALRKKAEKAKSAPVTIQQQQSPLDGLWQFMVIRRARAGLNSVTLQFWTESLPSAWSNGTRMKVKNRSLSEPDVIAVPVLVKALRMRVVRHFVAFLDWLVAGPAKSGIYPSAPPCLLPCRRSKPVVAAAGTVQDDLSSTAEPKNALLSSGIPLDTLRLVLSCTPNNLIVLVENALLKRVGGTSR